MGSQHAWLTIHGIIPVCNLICYQCLVWLEMIKCIWKPRPCLRLSDAYAAGASAEQRSALAAAVV